jgi:hypothetical protein
MGVAALSSELFGVEDFWGSGIVSVLRVGSSSDSSSTLLLHTIILVFRQPAKFFLFQGSGFEKNGLEFCK